MRLVSVDKMESPESPSVAKSPESPAIDPLFPLDPCPTNRLAPTQTVLPYAPCVTAAARAISCRCAGLVPQHPPQMFAPAATHNAALSPIIAGVTSYTESLTPSMRGSPALGFIHSGRSVAARAAFKFARFSSRLLP